MGAGLSLPLPLEELSQNALDGLVFLQIVLELVDFQQPPLPPRDMHADLDERVTVLCCGHIITFPAFWMRGPRWVLCYSLASPIFVLSKSIS